MTRILHRQLRGKLPLAAGGRGIRLSTRCRSACRRSDPSDMYLTMREPMSPKVPMRQQPVSSGGGTLAGPLIAPDSRPTSAFLAEERPFARLLLPRMRCSTKSVRTASYGGPSPGRDLRFGTLSVENDQFLYNYMRAPPCPLSSTNPTMKLFDRVLNPREIRRRLGLNQEQFWTQIGVTQSGGSRYESGREMPKPVRELLRLVHVEQIDLSQVKRVDFEIISYLKTSHPDLYRSLRRAVRGRYKEGPLANALASIEPGAGDVAAPIDLPLPATGTVGGRHT